MASTKYLVILLLVYLNFDILPLNSAAISPEWNFGRPENDDKTLEWESKSTTVTNDDDNEKFLEIDESQYIKNSKWFNDDKPVKNVEEMETHSKSQKVLKAMSEVSPKFKTNEDLTSENLKSTDSSKIDPTVENIVDHVHDLIDETIQQKTNRTDRTIVVVVTTNIFNVNNSSDEASKRQHTQLSFGTPNMIPRETSTDTNLDMHNKITTNFFNSNISPTSNKSGIIEDNVKESANGEEDKDAEVNHLVFENNPDLGNSLTENTEIGETTDATNEKLNFEEMYNIDDVADIDIRGLPVSVDTSEKYIPFPESQVETAEATIARRRFLESSSNVNLSNILTLKNIAPNRIEDELQSKISSKSFKIESQESPDSSLMEAMENILDSDVRKAFERDIPETRHVPLDINIEDDALKHTLLKDMNEYVIEEVRFEGSHDFEDVRKENENYKLIVDDADGVKDVIKKSEEVEQSDGAKLEKSLDEVIQTTEKKREFVPESDTGESNTDQKLSEPVTEEVPSDVFSSRPIVAENEPVDLYANEGSNLKRSDDSTFQPTQLKETSTTNIVTSKKICEIDAQDSNSSTTESKDEKEIIDEKFSTINFQQQQQNIEQYSTKSPEQEHQLTLEPRTNSIETNRRLRQTDEEIRRLESKHINAFAKAIYEKFDVPMSKRRYEDPDATSEKPKPTTKKPRIIPQLDVEDILQHPNHSFIDDMLSYDENATLLRDIEFTYERDDSFRDFRLEFAKSIHRAENRSRGIQVDDLSNEKEKNIGNIEIICVKNRPQRGYILDIADESERNQEMRYENLVLDYLEICTNSYHDQVPYTFVSLMNRFSLLKKERNNVVSDMNLYVVKLMKYSGFKSHQDYGGEQIFTLNDFGSLALDNDFEDIQSVLVECKRNNETGRTEFTLTAQDVKPDVIAGTSSYESGSEMKQIKKKLNRNVKNFEHKHKISSMLTSINQYVDLDTEVPPTVNRDSDRNLNAVLSFANDDKNIDEDIFISTTTKSDSDDVVSEVVKLDEETTEEHQIIKKPGVRNNEEFEIKPTRILNVLSNDLSTTEVPTIVGRSFPNGDEPVDPLRTLVEAVELTAEITKTFDNFQDLSDPTSSIHDAVNQVVETKDVMELVENELENTAAHVLNCEKSLTFSIANCIIGVSLVGLIVLLGLFSVLRFRKFKRSILFVN